MKAACVVIVLVAVALVGCASNPKPVAGPTLTTPVVAARPAVAKKTTQEATGELREAILLLRKVHFAYNDQSLSPAVRGSLTEAAAKLQEYPDVELYIDGHTDDRGSEEYNLALGDRRANAVREFLVQSGIPKSRLNIVSFGEEKPEARGKTDAAYAKNRRADFRLIRGNVRLVVEEGTLLNDKGQPMAAADAPEADARYSVK